MFLNALWDNVTILRTETTRVKEPGDAGRTKQHDRDASWKRYRKASRGPNEEKSKCEKSGACSCYSR